MPDQLKEAIRQEARRSGFAWVGVTTPEPPEHLPVFENWLAAGRHGEMTYLATEPSRSRRADPRCILPECRSILVLGSHYAPATSWSSASGQRRNDPPNSSEHLVRPEPQGQYLGAHTPGEHAKVRGRVASYAWGNDYHKVLAPRLKKLIAFIEETIGHRVASRWYTDTGPILERDLAQRAGLGWIGRNTCLINPRAGSYLLLSEILLGIELEPDEPFRTDHCGSCTRCIDACPTSCILPDRTLDARRCISYLTIELKSDVPAPLRPLMGDWVFGCDICQSVCPWNRFAPEDVDPSYLGTGGNRHPVLTEELDRSQEDFNVRASGSPLRRIGPVGYRRNTAIALGNAGSTEDLPALERALADPEPMIREHASWAIHRIAERHLENPADRNQQPGQD